MGILQLEEEETGSRTGKPVMQLDEKGSEEKTNGSLSVNSGRGT